MKRSAIVRFASPYVLGIASLGVMTFILSILQAGLSIQIVGLLYLLPVLLTATLWGLGPGIVASLVAFLAFNYFFIPPYHTFTVHQTQDLLGLIVFLLVAVVISQLLGMAKAGIGAATTREREATQLYELTTALSGLQDLEAIGLTIGKQVLETFCANQVEVVVRNAFLSDGSHYLIPEGTLRLKEGPIYEFPLSTARGQQGMVSIWRKNNPLTDQEQRLLRTFTSQGALAVEHAALAEIGNRAKVLEESDRLKTSLLSSVSHGLRTPLSTIKAAVTSLRGDDGELGYEARHELLAAIEEETDQLNILVGNLLDSSRIEMGALNPQRKWNSLREIVTAVLKRVHQLTGNHQISLEIPTDFPLVPVDYTQMEQVFINLISNSVKYAPEGTLIRIQANVLKEQVALVQVSNQGPPVADEHLGRIFEKFYRVTAADRITGTGLGLSICKALIEAHGGKIWAENGPELFIFKFTLPMTWKGENPHLPEEVKTL